MATVSSSFLLFWVFLIFLVVGCCSNCVWGQCNVTGLWTYNNRNYQYYWAETAGGAISFNSSFGDDPWTRANGTVSSPNNVTLNFFTTSGTVTLTGVVDGSCDFIIMEDEGVYVRVMPNSASGWLAGQTATLVRLARVTNSHGVVYLTPGFPIAYQGQWMRDSYYGFSSAWELLPNVTQAMLSAEYLFSLQRESDGVIPQWVDFNGNPTYGMYGGQQVLDSAPFAVLMASTFFENLPQDDALAFVERNYECLVRAMNAVPLSPSGLVWDDPSAPLVGYGFTDTIMKTGEILYTSLLFYDASVRMSSMLTAIGQASLASQFSLQANDIKANISHLWDPTTSMFRGATEIEGDVYDVWGSAYAAVLGLVTSEQATAMYSYFLENDDLIFFEGQAREMPLPQHWEQLFTGSDPRIPSYQNGGYWATPNHHVIGFVGMYNPDWACELFMQNIQSFMGHGINEWIGPFWPADIVGAPGYIASAANTHLASKSLSCASLNLKKPIKLFGRKISF